MSKSVQLNGISWKYTLLGERAFLLEPNVQKGALAVIHQTTHLLAKVKTNAVFDFIPAYQNIAFIFDRPVINVEEEVDKIRKATDKYKVTVPMTKTHQVPFCYELGLDWKGVVEFTSQEKETIVQRHLEAEYEVAMLGFIPGFVYLAGLNEKIACPRRKNPRTSIPAGSVGIAGNQTGIYSLESAGGWQIIGRSPRSFFDPQSGSPASVKPGDRLIFQRITEAEFRKMKEGSL